MVGQLHYIGKLLWPIWLLINWLLAIRVEEKFANTSKISDEIYFYLLVVRWTDRNCFLCTHLTQQNSCLNFMSGIEGLVEGLFDKIWGNYLLHENVCIIWKLLLFRIYKSISILFIKNLNTHIASPLNLFYICISNNSSEI